MNFILKFLDKATSYANKYAVQREMDVLKNHFENCIKRVDNRADLYFDEIKELNMMIRESNMRIAALEEKLSSHTKIVLWDDKERNAKLKKASKPMTATTAIIGIVQFASGEKLHYTKIYDRLKTYNLINPNVTLQSVKAILYQLARQNRIVLDNGTETGMFFIEKK